jgi:transcriptional regulator with XRE-family HTH domain
MGHARPRPEYLAEKLLLIRVRKLKLSQPQLAKLLGVRNYNHISKYEHDKNEPPLAVLLAYARAAQVPVEDIIDDDMDLFD